MIHSRKVAAIIPIKAQSKRIEEKNFKEFCGKPLFHHVIRALDRVYSVDEIIINTDSTRITEEAPKLSPKVRIHQRANELCGDYVSVNRLIEHEVNISDSDIYLQTHTTNPLIKPETFANALHRFIDKEGEYDSLFSVNTHQTRFYDHNLKPVNHNPAELIRTQDLPPVYEENSCIYIFTKMSFFAASARIGIKPVIFPTPRIESIDIDDQISWRIAELIGMHTLS